MTRAAEQELKRFLAAFDPAIGRLFIAARKRVHAAAPGASELIYDAYNAVSAAYSFTGRLAEAFLHVAAYPTHVNVGFNRGAGSPTRTGCSRARARASDTSASRLRRSCARPRSRG